MIEPILQPGDVMLTTDRASGLSGLIRWATRDRSRGEPLTLASHAGLIVSVGPLPQVYVVEAVKSIRKVVVGEAYPRTAEFAVYRPKNIPAEDIRDIVSFAHADIGKGYPYWQLVLHLMDAAIPGQPRIFRRFAGLSGRLVCSAIVGRWFAKAGYTFGSEDAEALTPDDIADYVGLHTNHWRCVRPWGEIDG